jgi:hypothetical protein
LRCAVERTQPSSVTHPREVVTHTAESRIGKAPVRGNRRAYPLVDFGVALVDAARFAGAFHYAARTALDAPMGFRAHFVRREQPRLDRRAFRLARLA